MNRLAHKARAPRTHQRASWSRGGAFCERRGLDTRLATGHVIEGILATRRQAARNLVHDRNDPPHDIAAVTPGDTVEQIAHRGADLRLSIVGAGEFPIVLI